MINELGYGLVVTGITGGGKTTITESIGEKHPELFRGLRMTNRQLRVGEVNGVDYEFSTLPEMLTLRDQNELLYFSEYYGNVYGMRKGGVCNQLESGNNVLIETVVHAADQLKHLPNMKIVFLDTLDEEVARHRLILRGMKLPEIDERMNYARKEREWALSNGIYRLINDNLELTVNQVEEYFDLNFGR